MLKNVIVSYLCMTGLFALGAFVFAGETALYPANRAPLARTALTALPLGAIRPDGWLERQLRIQADGLTGHLDEFWPSLKDSKWRGMAKGESWERGPYYLDGLVPLAWTLDDKRLKAKAQAYMEYILNSGQPDGSFGPCKDTWPLSVALKVLAQYYEATGDARVVPLMTNYFHRLRETPPNWGADEWYGHRAMETVLSAYWLYNRTGDKVVLEVARDIIAQCPDWQSVFRNFPFREPPAEQAKKYDPNEPVVVRTFRKMGIYHQTHVVNIAMALKNAGLRYEWNANEENRRMIFEAFEVMDKWHGQAGGRFSGDEHISGRRPTQGTELCAVVESMFSLENLIETTGDIGLADRLETLAYNANPGACTPDYWAHQYDQQTNQVLVDVSKRDWSTNDNTSNIYGLEPNFGCCTANMHQGWPKFVAHLWMATPDRGLAAVAYGPCKVNAKVADGTDVTVTVKTDYPFGDRIEFVVAPAVPAEFPLRLRIPQWTRGAKAVVAGKEYEAKPGSWCVIDRTWRGSETVVLRLPMPIRVERRYNAAVSLYRGPLLLALRVGSRATCIKRHALGCADWQLTPTTPWNYGLALIDPASLANAVETTAPGAIPFADDASPVALRVKARRVPDWVVVNNSAGETPKSPVRSKEREETIELVPYGCTRLRIAEFPVVEP